jgi:glyoxylase-like metal-dependent hydrolase (beta-lactamase superfamily II)
MSEPDMNATEIESISPGILNWGIHDNRINHRSDSYAVDTPKGTVLIDPLPLEDDLLSELGEVLAICLTGRFHQRAAWRYQQQFDVPVHAPHDGELHEKFAGEPDKFYRPGDLLPGGLEVIHAPGPSEAHYNFYLHHNIKPVIFTADLIIRESADDYFRFVPDEFMDKPEKTRESVRNILEMDVGLLCPNHGAYAEGNVHAVIRTALEKDADT